MNSIDARGLACPEPVLLTKKALANNENELKVMVDNPTAVQNVTRFATNQGFKVTSDTSGDDYVLTIKK